MGRHSKAACMIRAVTSVEVAARQTTLQRGVVRLDKPLRGALPRLRCLLSRLCLRLRCPTTAQRCWRRLGRTTDTPHTRSQASRTRPHNSERPAATSEPTATKEQQRPPSYRCPRAKRLCSSHTVDRTQPTMLGSAETEAQRYQRVVLAAQPHPHPAPTRTPHDGQQQASPGPQGPELPSCCHYDWRDDLDPDDTPRCCLFRKPETWRGRCLPPLSCRLRM